MSKYGKTFQILRKERKLTLKEVSENIVSYSYLSKFENEKSDITLTNLIRLLNRLNVTLDEFLNFNEVRIPYYVNLLKKVAIAYSKKDVQLLKTYYKQEVELYKENNRLYNRCNFIMVGAIIQDIDKAFYISKKDIEFYRDYLFRCSYWSTYEISLFGNALHLFTEDTLLLFLKEIKAKLKEFRVARKNIRDLISLIENACLILLRNENSQKAKELSGFLESYLSSNHYFEKTRKLFIDGIILICEEKTTEGIQKSQQAINIMYSLNKDLAKSHEKELESFLEQCI